jgi:hypothetical protein
MPTRRARRLGVGPDEFTLASSRSGRRMLLLVPRKHRQQRAYRELIRAPMDLRVPSDDREQEGGGKEATT